MNIKTKRYTNLPMPIVFIVMGEFDQDSVDQMLIAKKNPLESNMHLYTEKYFKDNIDHILKHIM